MKAGTPSATARHKPSPDLMKSLSILALIRTAYSSERSLMAWIRTSVSLYTFGFSISKFIDYLELQEQGTQFSVGPHRLGIALIALGIVALLFSMFEHLRRIQVMKRLGLPTTSWLSLPGTGAAVLVVIGVATLISLAGEWSG